VNDYDPYKPHNPKADEKSGEVVLFTGVQHEKTTDEKPKSDVGGVAADQLRSIIERIEFTNENIGNLNDDKKEIFAEAKANGFDTSAIKRVVQLRRMDPDKRAELEAVVDLYEHALGMK